MSVDLVAEPIIGWRLWKIRTPRNVYLEMAARWPQGVADDPKRMPPPSPIRIGSIGVETHIWPPAPAPAVCLQAANFVPPWPQHIAPVPNCQCGYWAFPTLKALAEFASKHPRKIPYAFGQVQLWGRIAEFDKGYRAQYARPIHVWLVGARPEQCKEIADYYDCSCEQALDIPGRRAIPEPPSPFRMVSPEPDKQERWNTQALKALLLLPAMFSLLPMILLSMPWMAWQIATGSYGGDLPVENYINWCEKKGIL